MSKLLAATIAVFLAFILSVKLQQGNKTMQVTVC